MMLSFVRRSTFAALLATVVLTSACASEDSEDLSLQNESVEQDEDLLAAADAKADSLSSTSTYYEVRYDTRRCAWPFCGGFWVSRANRAETRCADGRYAAECYVTDIDYSALGLSDEEVAAVSSVETTSIYRGTFKAASQSGINYTVLAAKEVWRSADGLPPSGVFYRVDDNKIRCITTPCPVSYHEAKLNSTLSTSVVGFTGVHAPKIVGELGRSGQLLIAGYNRNTRDGKKLNASQFYIPVKHVAVADDNSCTVDADCTRTSYSHYISSPSECYCTLCPTTVVNNDGADRLRASWEAQCSGVRMNCPLALCIRPLPVGCVAGQCATVAEVP